MDFLRKRTPGSMFKRLFTRMTLSVLLCITVAAFSMLLFFVNMWKTDRLAHLNGDALSLAQGVASLYAERSSETAQGADGSEEAFDLSDYMLFAAGSMQALAESVEAEIFFVSPEGAVLICSDYIYAAGGNDLSPAPCARHRNLTFDASLLRSGGEPQTNAWLSENRVSLSPPADKTAARQSTQLFLAAAPLAEHNEVLCYVVAMQPVLSAYLPYTTEFLRMLIFTGLLAVLLSFVMSFTVSYRMVKPLKTITAATKKYAGGDFSDHIAASDNYKELADLISSFNTMAENLELIEASRSSFVANVSHELKTPITIISGFIDGILDHTIPEEDTERYLRIVSDETKRLSRLVVAMLNMSKIEAGKLTLNLSDVRLRDQIYRALVGFEKVVEEKRITLEGLDGLDDCIVRADEALVSQIVYNLIDNAVKFTPDGGTISVSLRAEKKTALLTVRNSGRGIPPEECALIFDRFYKVDKSRGLDAKSFGMGLYIVKSIIELHHGTISVNSEPDAFTEFLIRLPMEQKSE